MKLSNIIIATALAATGIPVIGGTESKMSLVLKPLKISTHLNAQNVKASKANAKKIKQLTSGGVAKCDADTGLAANTFRCKDIDLVSFLTGEELGSPYASVEDPVLSATWVSDIWGWTDSTDHKEYALVGMWDGTSLVDISDPVHPSPVVFVESTNGTVGGLDGFNNLWRDIKVIDDVMYVGSEVDFHGVAAYDLKKLKHLPRGKTPVPIASADFITPELGSTHNLVAAPDAGKLIAVGMAADDKTCPEKGDQRAALAVFDISKDPVHPDFETCVYVDAGERGYVHDAHCIKYDGPDKKYKGTNICALFMEDDVAIYNLDSFELINKFTYESSSYVHQGWFSEDHTTIYADDELDELDLTTGTDFSTCYIFDVTSLDSTIAPPIEFLTPSDHPSIDHNLYVKDDYIYQAAYTSGARIRYIREDKTIEEVAFFDGEQVCECVAASDCDCDFFSGTWTYFPYFDSGITIAGGVEDGLFILQPTLSGCYDGSISKFVLYDSVLGTPVGDLMDGDLSIPLTADGEITIEAVVDGCVESVFLQLTGDDGRFDDRVERSAPYTLYGNKDGILTGYGLDRFSCDTTYTIEATPDEDASETKKIVFGFECL